MKPFLHSRGSVKRWGGVPADYDSIHDFIDGSKAAMPDVRHRAALHHAFGCFIVERVFGRVLVNSDGREVSTRDIAEQHIIEDLGFLPSLEDYLDELPCSVWHGGIHRIAREDRPPTPEQTREAMRSRVRQAFEAIVDDASYFLTRDPEALNKLIAAVRGTKEET